MYWLTHSVVRRKRANKRKDIEKVDHSKETYASFRKDFYIEVPEISAMTDEQVEQYRAQLDGIQIRVRRWQSVVTTRDCIRPTLTSMQLAATQGKDCPKPVRGFHQCGLSDKMYV